MDLHEELIRLRAMRGLLETRLLVLERAIGDQRQHGVAAPDLLKRVEALLARLEQVNAKLAKMHQRQPPGSGQCRVRDGDDRRATDAMVPFHLRHRSTSVETPALLQSAAVTPRP
ncbi:hypothetical protein [Azohydromonas australica]|uniref:hypothetical protein n=1 Tax=Azohydromonas australica TaxID=364039 RepID=UPI0012EB5A6D|nr:hypothetical protein [Azohydromonas australica]